jgi:hypothetical protein
MANKEKKIGGGVFGSILRAAQKAGEIYRAEVAPEVEKLKERATSVSGLVKSFTEEGQSLNERWAELQKLIQEGASDAITGIAGISSVAKEAIRGMDAQVAFQLLELYKLETMAQAKLATELSELVAAKDHFNQLKAVSEANGDISELLTKMHELVKSAQESMKKVPSSPSELRAAHQGVTGDISDLKLIASEHDAKLKEYLAKMDVSALKLSVDARAVEKIGEKLTEIELNMRSANMMAEAIPLLNLKAEIARLQAAYTASYDEMKDALERLRCVEATMFEQRQEAESAKVENDATLQKAGAAYIAATRHKPIDLAQAEEQARIYGDRLAELNT